MFEGTGKPLSEDGLLRAAGELGVGVPALWAVMTVETRGSGFLADRRPQILFERHIFHNRTNGRFDDAAPDLSNGVAGGYGAGGAFQYARLERAVVLDRKAALESASWGLGQVMGFNAGEIGFPDVEAMVNAMCESEDAQFEGMVAFIRRNDLSRYLQQDDWAGFAFHYNGAGFQKNKYDTKLAQVCARYRVGPLPNVRTRAAQLYLTYLNYNPKGVDGWFGQNTQKALMNFQKDRQLAVTGLLDDATFAVLGQAAMK